MTDSPSPTDRLPHSDRLEFRWWRAGDLDLALGLWGDPLVTKYIDARRMLSDGEVQEILDRQLGFRRDHGVQYWPIFFQESGEHVGCCGLRPHDPSGELFELGCQIRSAHWGRGFAAEASRAVIRFAFDELEVPSLFAGHHPRNSTSRHLLTKLGFLFTHEELYPPTGLMHPSYRLDVARYSELEWR